MPSPRSLPELAGLYGIVPASPEAGRLCAYLDLLTKWNAKVNLTATVAWPEISPLFEEALWASGYYPDSRVSHLDIGSGAGFPALVIRIVRPRMRLRLVESRSKKAAFLETAAAALGLEGVTVICARVEDYLETAEVEPPDMVSWKGLRMASGALDRLLEIGRRDVRFWLFHGSGLPLRNPSLAGTKLRLEQRAPFPGRPGWFLSVFSRARGCFT